MPELGAVVPVAGGQPDLIMSGTSFGQGNINGALAPSQFDPLAGYPAAPPPLSVPKNVGFAGLITATPVPPGPTLLLYCIDINTPTSPGVRYELGTWDEATVPRVGYVARLLNDYYPNTNAPAALTNPNDKAAAVQAAIWFFSDKYVLNSDQPRRSTVAAIAQDIIAKGPLVNPPPPSLTITPPAAEGPAESLIGPFTLNTTSPATVSATGGRSVPRRRRHATAGQSRAERHAVLGSTTIGGPDRHPGDRSGAGADRKRLSPDRAEAAQKLILAQTGTLQTKATASATAFDVGNLEVTKTVTGPVNRSAAPWRSARDVAMEAPAAIYPAGSPPTPLLVPRTFGRAAPAKSSRWSMAPIRSSR